MRWLQWHNVHSNFVLIGQLVYKLKGEIFKHVAKECVASSAYSHSLKKMREFLKRPSNATSCEQTRGSGDDPETPFKKMHHDTTAREEIHLRRK
jgi:hypothetical protein